MVFGRKNDVKNTTKDRFGSVFDLFSPLLCRGCGADEGYLCDCCKKYIINNMKQRKIEEADLGEAEKVFLRVKYLGFRDEILGEMIEEYKYFGVKKMGKVIAEVVYFGALQGEEGIICPMPTSRKHIRERGFDHILVIAKEIERLSRGKLKTERLLVRTKDTTQVGANEKVRKEQAKHAVGINPKFLESEKLKEEILEKRVIVLDDVWTTGASMTEAGKRLREAGIKKMKLEALEITKNRAGKSPEIRRGEFD